MKTTMLAALALGLLPLCGKANDTSGSGFDRAIHQNDARLFANICNAGASANARAPQPTRSNQSTRKQKENTTKES
jgi:hypothetical protein